MKKFLGFAAAAVLGMSSMAMAVVDPPQNVPVKITVAQNISFWSNNANILLTLSGGQQNGDAVAGSLSRINNVDAKLTVAVDGSLGASGVNFFIFSAGDAATIKAQMANDTLPGGSYNPTGALVWTQATLGATQKSFGGVLAATPSIVSVPVIYAANAPGNLPAPGDLNLTVTWTIAPN